MSGQMADATAADGDGPRNSAQGSVQGPARNGASGTGEGKAVTHCSTAQRWSRLDDSRGLDRCPPSGRAGQGLHLSYGQKHSLETEAARTVAGAYGMEHSVIELAPIRGSALTDVELPLPERRDLTAVAGIAPSYVPARNLLFLAHMASLQDASGPGVLWLGVHHGDPTGYPDCRPEFVEAADRAVRLGTQYGLRVEAPFVGWSKVDIVHWGLRHGVPYELTHSCYQGRRPACGVCDTCQVRLQAFAAAGP